MPVGHGRAENYAGKWEVFTKSPPLPRGQSRFCCRIEIKYFNIYSVESGVKCGDINELRGELFF